MCQPLVYNPKFDPDLIIDLAPIENEIKSLNIFPRELIERITSYIKRVIHDAQWWHKTFHIRIKDPQPPFPKNIDQFYREKCLLQKDKKKTRLNTHTTLLLIPKGLSLERLQGILPRKIGSRDLLFCQFFVSEAWDKHKSKKIEKAFWVCFATELISSNELFKPIPATDSSPEKNTMEDHLEKWSKLAEVPYTPPRLLPMITCIFAEFIGNNRQLFYAGWDSVTTCVQEKIEKFQLHVCAAGLAGVIITKYSSPISGIAPCLEFS